jgi:cardiolipin synthase A/B
VPDGPDEDLEIMPKAIFAAINAARREIRVMTPYFLPDPQIQWALSLASLRGVEVKILTPRANNIPPVRWAARTLYPALLERGARIYETRGLFDHTKFMTVDRVWSLIGSTNWDPRSLRLNFEFNLACFDYGLAAELNADFESKLAQSDEVTIEQLNAAGIPVRMRDGIARMFIPML